MALTARMMMTVISGLLVLTGLGLLLWMHPPERWWMIGLCALGAAGLAIAHFLPAGSANAPREPYDVAALDRQRKAELIRGTSMFLRDARYRYSIRLDSRDASERPGFVAEVNSVHLGFIPAVITDLATDQQGLGYVAFVHDGERWRGPGLPCPADQTEAIRHAARCVSPLAHEQE